MADEFETRWESFSDQLSLFLENIAAAENLSPETIDRMHFTTVMIYNDSLKAQHSGC